MNNDFSSRLKTARMMRGLSMDDLVRRMNGVVSKQSISKYERGLMKPNSQVLLAISKCLNLPIDYFYRDSIAIDKISFREDARIPARSSERLVALAQDKVERYLMLEDLLSIDSSFKNPLSRMRIQDYNDVEKAAELLRKQWELGTYPIFSVYEMMESVGVKIVELEVEDSNVMGFNTLVKGNIPLIVINLSVNGTVERKRFTALHELGHLLLKFSPSLDVKVCERMCNYFAAAVLCPLSVVHREIGTRRTVLTLDELTSLKSRYGISVSAIVHRVKDVGIITVEYYNQIFDQRIHQNLMEEGWGGYPIPECTDRFERLLLRAVAEQVISMSRAAELAGEKLGDFREKLDVI